MLLAVSQLNLAFGEKTLFDDTGFQIHPRERIGLVGPNGSGKTTLLKILNGLADSDSVSIDKPQDVKIGYLPQEGIVLGDRTVFDEVESSAVSIMDLRARMKEVDHILQSSPVESEEYKEAVDRMGHYSQMLEAAEAHKLPSRINKILFGLGFDDDGLSLPCSSFSGGWQMRIALAKLLLNEPDILMMDEPTNHLDLDSLRWLEGFLRSHDGALVVISHDRAFLDGLTNRILSLERGQVISYTGNYSKFLELREERKRQLEEAKKSQDRKIAATEQFIERFRYKSTKAAQVQSRIKQLDKVERIELESSDSRIHFRFPESKPTGHTVIQLSEIDKAYGENQVFSNFDLTIERGHRIGVVGVNGAGKSTLARILAGRESIQKGNREEGLHLEMGYFAQDQTEELPLESTVYDVAASFAHQPNETTVRNVLGAFLFSSDDTKKPVRVLSGGEKNRLALARLLLRPSNFIILDEPTNHLDIASKEVLTDALSTFKGTLFVVSHDRDFLEPVVDRILEVSPTGSRLFPGKLSEYLWKIDQERATQQDYKTTEVRGKVTDTSNPKEKRRLAAQLRQELAPIRKAISSAETRIEELEAHIEKREAEMANPEFFEKGNYTASAMREYESWKAELESVMADWEKNSELLAEKEQLN